MKLHHWGRKPPARKPFNWMIYAVIFSSSAGFVMILISAASIR